MEESYYRPFVVSNNECWPDLADANNAHMHVHKPQELDAMGLKRERIGSIVILTTHIINCN